MPRRRRGLQGAALTALCLSLGACASLIDPVDDTVVNPADYIPMQADWAEPAPDALPRADWVESFGDPALVEYIARARAGNPSVQRTIAQLDRALAQRGVSRADLFPQIGFSSRVQQNEGGTGFFAGSRTYSLGFSADWEVDVINRIRDQIASDGAGIEASAADVAALELSIVSRLALAWFDSIEAGLLVALSEEEIRTQERSLRLTQRRFESGLTGSSDVRLARSAIANAQATEQLRLQQRDATLRTVQTLMRDYPDAALVLPSDLPELPPLSGAGTPADMLARRPDVLAAERRIEQAGLNVDVARKALYPRLSLSSSIGDETVNNSQVDGDIFDILDLQGIAYSLAASVTAPIFQGGRLRAQVEAQRAQLAAQIETYAETVLTAYQEVENALDAEERLAAREAALHVSLDEAVMAEERLELRYTEGLATILQLLDAQSRRINAEGQLITARAERLSNRVRLHVALGGSGYVADPTLEETNVQVLPDYIDDLLP